MAGLMAMANSYSGEGDGKGAQSKPRPVHHTVFADKDPYKGDLPR